MSKRSKAVLATGAAVLFAAGLFFGIELAKPPPPPDLGALRTPAAAPDDPAPPPVAETRPSPSPPAPPAPARAIPRQPPPGGKQPRIAIVIDDLGRSMEDLDALAQLGIPLTYSVLPYEPRTAQVAAELRRRGLEVLCHLPMEARSGADPGPGAVRAEMSREEVAAATRRALDAVPGAAGANNHMGSSIAPDRGAMTAVLGVLAERRLYFVDSRTSADTLGYSLARELGIPAAERQVFLDTDSDPQAIRARFRELVATAERRGGALAIAHPYAETLAVLAAELPAARARGIELVAASALLDR